MPQRKSKKILIYLFLFLIIGTLNNKEINNFELTKITKIGVVGLDQKNNIEIKNSLDYLKKNNLFFLNKLKITDLINSNSLVENFSVYKIYPSSLNILISRAKLLAQVEKNGEIFYLGSNGKLIKEIGIKVKLPFIFGDFDNESFFELKKKIDKTNFNFNEIKNLIFFKSGRWDIETTSGVLIKLPKTDLKRYIDLFVIILREDHNKEISKIDFRQSKQIIING
jgi:cell division protein FtsQ